MEERIRCKFEEKPVREILEEVKDATVDGIYRYWRRHTHCFRVPVVQKDGMRMPRIRKGIGYVAMYTKDGKYAYVFTNSDYLLFRSYATRVSLIFS